MLNKRHIAVMALAVAASSIASAQGPAAATDIRDAMFSALKSPAGTFKGELTGPTGATIRQVTKSSGPVFAEISTVKTFTNPECKRLKTSILAPQAIFADPKTGQQKSFNYTFFMNMCPDGSPPEDGLSGIGPDEGVRLIKEGK